MQRRIWWSKLQKCPSYLSVDIGGHVPLSNWLVSMFCTVVDRMRAYLDSECIARLTSSKIVAIDAYYKIPNWIMRWGDVKLFNTLESDLNEYGEIIIQQFENLDSHRQLEPILRTLILYGLNPDYIFTDVPDRGSPFFERIFPSLTEGITESNDKLALNNKGLPTLPLRDDFIYADNNEVAVSSLNLFIELLEMI